MGRATPGSATPIASTGSPRTGSPRLGLDLHPGPDPDHHLLLTTRLSFLSSHGPNPSPESQGRRGERPLRKDLGVSGGRGRENCRLGVRGTRVLDQGRRGGSSRVADATEWSDARPETDTTSAPGPIPQSYNIPCIGRTGRPRAWKVVNADSRSWTHTISCLPSLGQTSIPTD